MILGIDTVSVLCYYGCAGCGRPNHIVKIRNLWLESVTVVEPPAMCGTTTDTDSDSSQRFFVIYRGNNASGAI